MRCLLLALSVAAAACGSAPPTTTTATTTPTPKNPNGGQVCTEERTTGTNMTRTVCRSEDAAQDERNAARNWYSAPRPSPTVTK